MPDAATPVPRLDLLARKIMICSVAYILNVKEQHFIFGSSALATEIRFQRCALFLCLLVLQQTYV